MRPEPKLNLPLASEAVVIFTRLPREESKQLRSRKNTAQHLHTALVLETLARAARTRPGTAVVLATDGPLPPSLRAGLARCAQAAHPVHVLRQHGEGFGARFLNTLRDTAALGVQRMVAVGTDIPSLASADLQIALDEERPTFGPAFDGGFYLVGLRADQLELLERLPWQRPDLMSCLKARLAAHGLPCVLLKRRLDLDSPRQVHALLGLLSRLVRRRTGLSLGQSALPTRPGPRGEDRPGPLSPSLARQISPRGPPLLA